MKKTIFTGAGVAIVTPMNADGSINYHNLRNNRRKCYHDRRGAYRVYPLCC